MSKFNLSDLGSAGSIDFEIVVKKGRDLFEMNMIRSCGLDDISTAYVDRKRKESVIVRRHNDIVGDIILAPDLSIFQDVFKCKKQTPFIGYIKYNLNFSK